MSTEETGFGAPEGDAGFGAPSAAGTGDTGFGSPAGPAGLRLEPGIVSDDGGEIVAVVGSFAGNSGPYRVFVLTGEGELPCYSGVFGQGALCHANAAGTRLEFVTPPATPGIYDLRIEGAEVTTLAGALTYVSRVHKDSVYALRQRWPASMPAGLHSLRDEPFTWEHAPSADVCEPFVKALGEELAKLSGRRMVRSTAPFSPTATSLEVDSTYTLPDAGVVYAEGLDNPRLAYTGKTEHTLTGIARDPFETRTLDRGAVLTESENAWSTVDHCVQDLLLTRATGSALDRLALAVLGLDRPGPWMNDAQFRALCLVVSYLDCGGWWAVWRVCEAWLLPFAHEGTATLLGQTLTDTSAPFRAHHVGRYVRVFGPGGSAVHRIQAFVSTTEVELEPRQGPYWTAAQYPETSRAYRLLPFIIERDCDAGGTLPGAIRVRCAAPALNAPATYLQVGDEADYAAVILPALTATGVDLEAEPGAAGDNYRGFLQGDASDDGTELQPDVPIYIFDPDIPALRELLSDVVAAWCTVEIDTLAA